MIPLCPAVIVNPRRSAVPASFARPRHPFATIHWCPICSGTSFPRARARILRLAARCRAAGSVKGRRALAIAGLFIFLSLGEGDTPCAAAPFAR